MLDKKKKQTANGQEDGESARKTDDDWTEFENRKNFQPREAHRYFNWTHWARGFQRPMEFFG